MNRWCILSIILLFISVFATAQTDTADKFLDTNVVNYQTDSVNKSALVLKIDSTKNTAVLIVKPISNLGIGLVLDKEYLFYYILLLFFIFGLLYRSFNNWFKELFQYFFRITIKHRETREYLLFSVFPSFLTNIFFLLSVGLYVNFQLVYFGLSINNNFWIQYVYCISALSVIYLLKFLGLKFTSWMFGEKKLVDSYMFVVFGLNKILGILILPFLLALAFGNNLFFTIALNVSWVGVAIFYLFRIVLTYIVAQRAFRIGPLHFLIYAASFEVLPLFIAYKILYTFFN